MDRPEVLKIIRQQIENEVGGDSEVDTKTIQLIDRLMQGFAMMVTLMGERQPGTPIVGVAITIGAILATKQPEIAKFYTDALAISKYNTSMQFIVDAASDLFREWSGETVAPEAQSDTTIPDFLTNIKDWNF